LDQKGIKKGMNGEESCVYTPRSKGEEVLGLCDMSTEKTGGKGDPQGGKNFTGVVY